MLDGTIISVLAILAAFAILEVLVAIRALITTNHKKG
jgi:hypothetical protein